MDDIPMPPISEEDEAYQKEVGRQHEISVRKEIEDWLSSGDIERDTEIYNMLSYKILSLQSDVAELDVEIQSYRDKQGNEIFNEKYVEHILLPKRKGIEQELSRIRFQYEKMQKSKGIPFMQSSWDEKVKRAREAKSMNVVYPYLQKIREQTGSVVALCPFHEERTQSFRWYEDEHFHCFGCGAHGKGVIDFWMLLKKVDFKTAVDDLSR